jgi:hypothetical protein
MRKRIFTLICISMFFLTPLISNASHFRYGHISWTRASGTRTVTFTITTAWRYDASESIDFNYGDGSSTFNQLGIEILSVPNEYKVFKLQLTHIYSSDGPFTAFFSNCCRISNLQYGADDNFDVSAIVCLANNNLGSPAYDSNSPVILEMNPVGNNQIQLVNSDPDGSPITYSAAAIRGNNYLPNIGLSVASVSSTGLISWNTTGSSTGQLYQMKVTMSDGCAKSEIDFIIKIGSQLIACYPFNGNAQDNVGNHHGTVVGATPTTDRFGRPNSAYQFSPVYGNYISLDNKQDFVNNMFTVSAWVNIPIIPNINNSATWPIGKDIFSITDDNRYGIMEDKWAWDESSTPTGAPILPNVWYHVTFVRFNTLQKIYVNGVLVSTTTGTNPNLSLETYYGSNEMTKVMIGARESWRGFDSHNFGGKIDDVRFYRGALSNEQVQTLATLEDCEQPCINFMASSKSGNWDAPSTWECGSIPKENDIVMIKPNHTVTINGATVLITKMKNLGILIFQNNGELKLKR